MLDTIAYDGYGNIASETNSAYRGRYAWTGREIDVETGLQYNRARYYDSSIGKWISQDPIGFNAGDSNLYRYATNRPTMEMDPSGMQRNFNSNLKGREIKFPNDNRKFYVNANEVFKNNLVGIEVSISTNKPDTIKANEFYWVHLIYRFNQLHNDSYSNKPYKTQALRLWKPRLKYGEQAIRFIDRQKDTLKIWYNGAGIRTPQIFGATDIPTPEEFGNCKKTGFVGEWILSKGNTPIYWIHWELISINKGFYSTEISDVKGVRISGKENMPAFLKAKQLVFGYKTENLSEESKVKIINPFK